MTRRYSLLATVAVVALLVAVVPLVGVATPGSDGANATGVAPGEQLGGVVDVGEAELETDVASRAFGLAVARADSPAAKAAVIKRHVDDVERSVRGLEARLEALRAARENGSLSSGAFKARVAGLAAERAGAVRLANATAVASADLPPAVLTANGVNVTAIRQLRDRARDLGGPDVAAIAREIAGPAVGQPPGPPEGVPGRAGGTAGGPGGGGNATGDTGAATAGTGPSERGSAAPPERSRKVLVRFAE